MYLGSYLRNQIASYDEYLAGMERSREKIPESLHCYLVDRYSGDSYYENCEELPREILIGPHHDIFYYWRTYGGAVKCLQELRDSIVALKEEIGDLFEKRFELFDDGEIQEILRTKMRQSGANPKAWPFNCINWTRAVEDYKRPLKKVNFMNGEFTVVIND